MSDNYKYSKRGVSATKDEVHQAIKHLDKGLFPYAFCKILPDIVGGDKTYCNLMHADTAGTKTSLAYIYWKETGDVSVWRGIAQDALIMNLDDMACVGCTNDIVVSSTIGRNKNLITGEVIATLINATTEIIENLKEYGVNIHLAGGETADVGDIVRTIDVGYTAFARMKRADVIENNIQDGDVIIGLASYGKATYEDQYNGGMGSNGLTSARHDVLNKVYKKRYPDSYDANTPDDLVYIGSKKVTDTIKINDNNVNIGQLILSPTRTYLPLLREIIKKFRNSIHGMIHCTGGGQAKVLKFIKNKHIIKNNLFPTPPLFELIQQESQTYWKEMYQVFNMGHRMELYVPKAIADDIIELASAFDIDAQIVGYVKDADTNQLTIESPYGDFDYT